MGATLGELKATMNHLKGNLRSQMEAMEADLVKVPFPEYLLTMKLRNAETDRNEVGNLYERILVLTELKQTEDERLAFEEFEIQYRTTSVRVRVALDTH